MLCKILEYNSLQKTGRNGRHKSSKSAGKIRSLGVESRDKHIQSRPFSAMVTQGVARTGAPPFRIQENKIVYVEPKITLDCPSCGAAIYETLGWFKKTYSTCPVCDNGLAASQFSTVISQLEEAMDSNIDEMLYGQPHSSCCGKDTAGGKQHSCCKASSGGHKSCC
jgi:hypothetical protein